MTAITTPEQYQAAHYAMRAMFGRGTRFEQLSIKHAVGTLADTEEAEYRHLLAEHARKNAEMLAYWHAPEPGGAMVARQSFDCPAGE